MPVEAGVTNHPGLTTLRDANGRYNCQPDTRTITDGDCDRYFDVVSTDKG